MALTLCLGATPASAQSYGGWCEDADSTAAAARCLKRSLDDSQKRLSVIYDKMTKLLKGEALGELNVLQQQWISYRDAECAWQESRAEGGALSQVNKLSCLARMSADRADLLGIMLADAETGAQQRQVGSFPRWMNVLSKDYPEVYWNYGKRLSADLNCDGQDEKIMSGYAVSALKTASLSSKDGKTDALPPPYGIEVVVAIADNPPTGRPSVSALRFPVGKHVCHHDPALKYETISQEEGDASCAARLTLSSKGCDPVVIRLTGKAYEVEAPPAPATDK